MQPFFIDTHAHIYLPEFDQNREKLLIAARDAGVKEIYLPAIDSSTHESMLQTEKDFPLCKSMMGLHPCSVKEDYENEISIIKNYLAGRKFIAVGEIGLDFYWDKTFAKQQYEAFHQQIELALQYKLPIVIHSRNAIDECIDVVAQYPALRGVFHCFSGSEEQARKITELQFLLGIGGVVTFKNSGLDKVISRVGLSAVVLETDAPYLAPVPYRGKRNEPSYTKLVAEKISSVLGISVKEVGTITTRNAEKLFSFEENP
ncbi:MAG TPA: TatD family hydrolase [Flavisolibacter sp.]|jgi:TatD DNase family protein